MSAKLEQEEKVGLLAKRFAKAAHAAEQDSSYGSAGGGPSSSSSGGAAVGSGHDDLESAENEGSSGIMHEMDRPHIRLGNTKPSQKRVTTVMHAMRGFGNMFKLESKEKAVEEAKFKKEQSTMVNKIRTQVSNTMKLKPQGNVYRGWAVGIQRGSSAMVMTFLVIVAQFLTPVLMISWACRTVRSGSLGSPHLIWKVFLASPELLGLHVMLVRLVGFVFLLLLYVNGDHLLRKQDQDAVMLKKLVGKRLKKGWMYIDAFLNGWVVSLCAIALPMSLWTATDVKEVVLDAFGFLFLYNLDDYDSVLSIGVQEDDFDDLMEKLLEGLYTLEKKDGTGFLHHHGELHMLINRFKNGGFFFSVARLVNFMVAAFALPSFLILVWIPPDPNVTQIHASRVFTSLWGILWNPYVQICGVLTIFVVVTARSVDVYRKHAAPRMPVMIGNDDPREAVTGRPSWTVLFLKVIFPIPMDSRGGNAAYEEEEDGDT